MGVEKAVVSGLQQGVLIDACMHDLSSIVPAAIMVNGEDPEQGQRKA
jgi:hypothetical protein